MEKKVKFTVGLMMFIILAVIGMYVAWYGVKVLYGYATIAGYFYQYGYRFPDEVYGLIVWSICL